MNPGSRGFTKRTDDRYRHRDLNLTMSRDSLFERVRRGIMCRTKQSQWSSPSTMMKTEHRETGRLTTALSSSKGPAKRFSSGMSLSTPKPTNAPQRPRRAPLPVVQARTALLPDQSPISHHPYPNFKNSSAATQAKKRKQRNAIGQILLETSTRISSGQPRSLVSSTLFPSARSASSPV